MQLLRSQIGNFGHRLRPNSATRDPNTMSKSGSFASTLRNRRMDSRGGPDPHPKTRGSARFPEQNSFRIERLRPCLGPFLSEKENAVLPVPAEFLDHFRGAISAAMVHKHEGRGAGGQESFKR